MLVVHADNFEVKIYKEQKDWGSYKQLITARLSLLPRALNVSECLNECHAYAHKTVIIMMRFMQIGSRYYLNSSYNQSTSEGRTILQKYLIQKLTTVWIVFVGKAPTFQSA